MTLCSKCIIRALTFQNFWQRQNASWPLSMRTPLFAALVVERGEGRGRWRNGDRSDTKSMRAVYMYTCVYVHIHLLLPLSSPPPFEEKKTQHCTLNPQPRLPYSALLLLVVYVCVQ